MPGFLADRRLWTGVVKGFPLDYSVVVLDFLDCSTLQEMIDKVSSVSFATFNLVGFSMGGYVSQAFAVQHPNRVTSLSLVAVNVGALSDKEKQGRLATEKALKNTHYKGISERSLDRYLHPDSLKKSDVVNAVISMSQAYTSEMYINHARATLERIDFSEYVNKEKYPVLIVAGANDKVVPLQNLKEQSMAISRSQFEVVEQTGHYIPLEQPLVLQEILHSFLASQQLRN